MQRKHFNFSFPLKLFFLKRWKMWDFRKLLVKMVQSGKLLLYCLCVDAWKISQKEVRAHTSFCEPKKKKNPKRKLLKFEESLHHCHDKVWNIPPTANLTEQPQSFCCTALLSHTPLLWEPVLNNSTKHSFPWIHNMSRNPPSIVGDRTLFNRFKVYFYPFPFHSSSFVACLKHPLHAWWPDMKSSFT